MDVGNNTYSFGRYFECTRQAVLMSGYLGSIGFALPAALGAWAATQEEDTPFAGRQVISVSGDGGFGQYMGELTTAVKYGVNLTHVLLNNSQLGKISKEQRSGSWPVWQTDLHNPDFAAYARLCGAHGRRVERAEEIDEALREALDHDGPALVELITDAELSDAGRRRAARPRRGQRSRDLGQGLPETGWRASGATRLPARRCGHSGQGPGPAVADRTSGLDPVTEKHEIEVDRARRGDSARVAPVTGCGPRGRRSAAGTATCAKRNRSGSGSRRS